MATKKTTETSASPFDMSGWGSLLLETIVGGIRGVVEGTVGHIKHGVETVIQKLARRTGFLLFAFVGILFLLVGAARFLDDIYRIPGSGELVVGVFVFSFSIFAYILDNQNNS